MPVHYHACCPSRSDGSQISLEKLSLVYSAFSAQRRLTGKTCERMTRGNSCDQVKLHQSGLQRHQKTLKQMDFVSFAIWLLLNVLIHMQEKRGPRTNKARSHQCNITHAHTHKGMHSLNQSAIFFLHTEKATVMFLIVIYGPTSICILFHCYLVHLWMDIHTPIWNPT